MFQKALKTLK